MTPKDAASCLPRKTLDCQLKALGDDAGTFELYALVFGDANRIDRQGDVIEPGAVTNCDELVKDGWIALNHKGEELPLAMIDTAIQDGHGLKLTGRFHSTPTAQEARTIIMERLAAGKACKTSIGYLVPEDGQRYETVNGEMVRFISKLSVYEASYVNLPANPDAEIISAKRLAPTELEESMAKDAAVITAVKRALGLAVKGDCKVSAEQIEKVKGLVDKCATSAKNLDDMHKSMKGFIDGHRGASEELVKCIKSFGAGQPEPEADDDSEGNVADKPRKPENDQGADKADDDEEAKDDEDEEDKTKKAYRADLQKRALSGRRSQLCP